MTRLMRYMLNYRGKKLVVAYCNPSKKALYNLPPPIIEQVRGSSVSECFLKVVNQYEDGTIFRYTTDGSYPTLESPILESDMVFKENCIVKVIAVHDGDNFISVSASYGSIEIDNLRNGIPMWSIG